MADGDTTGIDVFWFRYHAAMKNAPTGNDAVDTIDDCGASWEVSKIGESMKSGPRDPLEDMKSVRADGKREGESASGLLEHERVSAKNV
jgi:hypothetical protein